MKKLSHWIITLFTLFWLVGGSLSFAQHDLKTITEEQKAALMDERRAPADVAAIPGNATTTESGLGYRVITPGTGTSKPGPNDLVTITYKAWTQHGVRIEMSGDKPQTFQVNMGAPGIAEALQKMVIGDTFRVWITPELGIYAGKKPKWNRVYDIDLTSIVKAPEAPANLAQPPEDVIITDSGLKYIVLNKGRGNVKPGPEDMVTIDYNRWSPEGKLLGSSIRRKKPDTFEIDAVVEGFAETLLGMTAGEKRRVWLPPELGDDYQEGDVIYDVELYSFISPPADLAAAHRSASEAAIVTDSGLAYEVLWPGNGDRHPEVGDTVIINFTVWKKDDGSMLDTSFKRAKPVGMTIAEDMPPGWMEVILKMVEGERRRAWLPASLGFPGPADEPLGDQIFEIDLLKIE